MKRKEPIHNHPRLIELCANCPELACIEEQCGRYKELEAELRNSDKLSQVQIEKEKPAAPKMMISLASDPLPDDESAKNKGMLLKKYNKAIRGLDVLTEDDDFSGSTLLRSCKKLLQELREERRMRFEDMVDWDGIAGGT